MGMVVRTNTMSTNAYRQLGMNNSAVSKSLEKLSSGFRINRAGDDASGLAISEKMKAQINGLEQAAANSQDGISLIQTAEGATTEIHNMLNRMVTLATKSANGTIQNDVDRESIQTEVNALSTEITRIAKATNFNGINLLDGSMGTGTTGVAGTIAISNTSADTVDVEFSAKSGTKLVFATGAAVDAGTNTASKVGDTITVTLGTKEAAEISEDDINKLFKENNIDASVKLSKNITVEAGKAATMAAITSADAKQASFNYTPAGTTTKVTVTSDKAGAIPTAATVTVAATGAVGATVAGDTGAIALNLEADKKYTASDINSMLDKGGAGVSFDFKGELTGTELTKAATALAGGAGLASGGGLTLQVGDTNDDFNKVTVAVDDLTAEGLGVAGLDVSSQTAAGDAIQTIKDAINQVSTNRGNLGALQNRLEYTINNLDTTNENMTAANSRIRDTDMAKEMMNYTKMNILTQAAQAMLAQANQQPQQILQLLQ